MTKKQRSLSEQIGFIGFADHYDVHGGAMLRADKVARDDMLQGMLADGLLKQAKVKTPAGQVRLRVTPKGRAWAKKAANKLPA